MSSSTKLLVVIDTNVLISGTLWGGKPGRIIKKWRKGKFDLLISPFILAELINFLDQYHIKQHDKDIIINELNIKPIKIIPPPRVNACRDKKDNQILDLCLTGKADYLISGDKDLLALEKFENTWIVKPDEFLERMIK